MMASMFSGVTGLKNNLVKMNVIGNNIANVNTVGFKAGRVTFREALVQTYKAAGRPSAISGGTNPVQLGLGMQVSTIDNMFQQGGMETTGQITDLAIQGSGFFILSDGTGRFYTRNGAFGFDANSTLVDPATGMFVQGKMADQNGEIPSSATTGNIVMPFGQQEPPRATTEVNIGNNLNATATESVPTLTSAGTTGITDVYSRTGTVDGAGGTHTLTIAGAQATQSNWTGTNVCEDPANPGNPLGAGLAGTHRLSDLGVTVFDDFQITVDNGTAEQVTGLTANSTINDLIAAINQVEGVTAELSGGEIVLTRDRAGDGTDYNIQLSVSEQNLAGGIPDPAQDNNISGVIFGVADSFTQMINNGTDHSFTVTDVFTPTIGPVQPAINLDVVVDDTSGLAVGIEGLGGGGVEIEALNGLSAGTAVIETDDTTHATSITVYDSQGGKHSLTLEFYKSVENNTWYWTASFNGNEQITGGGSGQVRFNSDGSLLSWSFNGGGNTLNFNPNNGSEEVSVELNVGTVGKYDGITSFEAQQHTTSFLNQNGYSLGILDNISIDKGGNIIGIFTNGVSRRLAQIIMADFNNQAGLVKAGRSLYQESANSGEAIEGVAGATISGTITSGALEASSVDISEEFTSMITAQRGFQANARIITTSDQMLDELVNLKR